MIEEILGDIRIATRRLRGTPGFTLAAVLTLGLGLGLAAAVLTVARTLLIRPLPVVEEDRLLVLAGVTSDLTIDRFPVDIVGAAELAAGSRTLESLAFHDYGGPGRVTVVDGERVFRLRRALVSGNWFDVLGAQPLLGRALRVDDDVPGAAPVVVLSHGAWMRAYGGDPGILGRPIRFAEDERAYTVVGIMPIGLDYPRGVEAWAPLRSTLAERVIPLTAVNLVGRLRPSGTAAAAREEMTAYFQKSGSAFVRDVRGLELPLARAIIGDVRPALLALSSAAALLLLIACANVANLLLIRGLRDARDVAVRVALGGGRVRIVAQRIVEHTVLGGAGAISGVIVATGALRAFRAFAPANLPRLEEIVGEGVVLGVGTLAVVSVLCFGVLPAMWAVRIDPQRLLRGDPRHGGGRSSRALREALVTGQVMLAVLVLSAAVLIGGSLIRLQRADLHFNPADVLVAEFAYREDVYPTAASQKTMLDALLAKVRALPGVMASSSAVAPPFTQTAWDGRMAPEGRPAEEAARGPLLNLDLVEPEYFAAIGLPVLQGRTFDDSDREGSTRVVILSESAARHYWPGQDPIGRRLAQGSGANRPILTVVGIVPDARYRDLREARSSAYLPLAQSAFPFIPTTLVIRTTRTPSSLAVDLREVMSSVGPAVTLANVAPFDAFAAAPLAQPRMNALLLAVFASAAVALSAIGLAAVLAAMVRQRRHELGVRMALGASGLNVQRLVWMRGMTLAGVGAALGVLIVLPLNRLWAPLLFETSPTDPMTLGLTALGVVVVAGLASLQPARSTVGIRPMDALRAD